MFLKLSIKSSICDTTLVLEQDADYPQSPGKLTLHRDLLVE